MDTFKKRWPEILNQAVTLLRVLDEVIKLKEPACIKKKIPYFLMLKSRSFYHIHTLSYHIWNANDTKVTYKAIYKLILPTIKSQPFNKSIKYFGRTQKLENYTLSNDIFDPRSKVIQQSHIFHRIWPILRRCFQYKYSAFCAIIYFYQIL